MSTVVQTPVKHSEERFGKEPTLPIAEYFVSPQGEGLFTGTLMCFLRLAGCTVGKPYSRDERIGQNLKLYQEKCTAWDGTTFACDTNYKMAKKLTAPQILSLPEISEAERICITGGEPLMHDLKPLLSLLWYNRKKVHIETSGTISFLALQSPKLDAFMWTTVSPKRDYLPECIENANEIKVLIDRATFKEREFLDQFEKYLLWTERPIVWIQPVNYELDIDQANVRACLELQKKYPRLRLSIQAHKAIGVR